MRVVNLKNIYINNNFSCLPSWWGLLCGGAYCARAHCAHWVIRPCPLTLNFCGRSGVMCSNCVKFEQNRTIRCRVIDDLAHYRRQIFEGVAFTRKDLRGAWTELHQTWTGHTAIICGHWVCFRVEISCCIFKRRAAQRRATLKMRPNFALFDPCKN